MFGTFFTKGEVSVQLLSCKQADNASRLIWVFTGGDGIHPQEPDLHHVLRVSTASALQAGHGDVRGDFDCCQAVVLVMQAGTSGEPSKQELSFICTCVS